MIKVYTIANIDEVIDIYEWLDNRVRYETEYLGRDVNVWYFTNEEDATAFALVFNKYRIQGLSEVLK